LRLRPGGGPWLASVQGAPEDSLQARHEPINRPADAPSEGDAEALPPLSAAVATLEKR